MEEETLDLEFNRSTNERPKFISVLCILSWIYVAFAALSGLSNALTPQEKLEEQLEVSKAQIEESPMASSEFMQDMLTFSDATMESAKTMNLIVMILILIEGAAVFMMFKQQRNGFWIYSIVQILIIAVSVYYLPWPNVFTIMVVGFYVLLSALFIILYGVNLKHMK